ncbi:MAG TPA: hypothetical protein VFR90_07850 [Methylibium sp.]|uniref:hypothetical protein n=1 Tax=Methylibium sp. TaxID=2067992 RepID=UPI002DB8D822|nr:hypothetical protein [Methylibium sp.]HEU4459019.1 hypothetical protein [Methylibium sp.]
MESNWVFAVVAGVALVSAACQPYDFDDSPTVKPPRPEAVERESQRLDERIARHKERWKARKQQYAGSEP